MIYLFFVILWQTIDADIKLLLAARNELESYLLEMRAAPRRKYGKKKKYQNVVIWKLHRSRRKGRWVWCDVIRDKNSDWWRWCDVKLGEEMWGERECFLSYQQHLSFALLSLCWNIYLHHYHVLHLRDEMYRYQWGTMLTANRNSVAYRWKQRVIQ